VSGKTIWVVFRALPERADLAGDVLGVVLHPSEQRRAARVLPGQPEEIETGRLRDAAPVHRPPALVEHGDLDPRVVRPEAGGPDDRLDVDARAVVEPNGRPGGPDGPPV